MAKKNDPILGAMTSRIAGGETLAGTRWDPVPVTATPLGDSAFGISQLVGNGWEWTSTIFQPFPGFQPFSCYPGYSARFFDGDHYVLKGASSRTDVDCCADHFATGSGPTTPMSMPDFGVWRTNMMSHKLDRPMPSGNSPLR